jgi:hypothetical protein
MRRSLAYIALPLAPLLVAAFVVSAAACLVQDSNCCSDESDGCEDKRIDTECADSGMCHCVCALTSVEPPTTDSFYFSPLCGRSSALNLQLFKYELSRSIDRPPRHAQA